MKYDVRFTSQFKKDLKKACKQCRNLDKLFNVINCLAEGEVLDPVYKNHSLVGNYSGCYECHIESDWLLVYKYFDEQLMLMLLRVGTHSELFR